MRFRRVVWIVVLALVGGAAFLGWLLLPWRRIEGLRVDTVRIVATDRGGPRARRMVVRFSTDDDLRDVLTRYGAGFVTARLFPCDDDARGTRIVVVQRGGYLVDEGRVRTLPGGGAAGAGSRARYQAIFDDRMSSTVDGRIVSTPALGVPLCLTLEGGGMFMGRIRAETIPLAPFLRQSS